MTARIVHVKAENVKGVRLVEFRPKAVATLIGGKNRQGKSSLLDAICMALGGKKLVPEVPIRKGAESGRVQLEISGDPAEGTQDIYVVRTFTRDPETGKVESQLEITSKDGFQAGSPQGLLDDLIGRIGFDPLSFMRLPKDKQSAMLIEMLGIDTSELDRQHARLYQERTMVGREGERAAAALAELPPIPLGTPAEEESVQEVVAKVSQARSAVEELRTTQAKLDYASVELSRRQQEVERLRKAIEVMNQQMREQEEAVAYKQKERDGLLEALAAKPSLPDLEAAVTNALKEADAIGDRNAAVRRAKAKEERRQAVEQLRSKYKAMTKQLEEIASQKRQQIADAKWPIDGLGLRDGEIVFGDVPLSQASTAENVRVSVAIGAASAKKLKAMFIREGSLVDDDMLELIVREAAERQCQLFIERVGKGAENHLVICEGEIATDENGNPIIDEACKV